MFFFSKEFDLLYFKNVSKIEENNLKDEKKLDISYLSNCTHNILLFFKIYSLFSMMQFFIIYICKLRIEELVFVEVISLCYFSSIAFTKIFSYVQWNQTFF